MRSLRIRNILALSLVVALVGCSSGGTGTNATGGSNKTMQRSSRILKKKKPTGSAMSAATRKPTLKAASSTGL